MADNASVTAKTIAALQLTEVAVATDDIGGVHYQRVKATFGADGTATDVSAATPLPVGTRTSIIGQQGRKDITAGPAVEILAANPDRTGAYFHVAGDAHIALGEVATTNHPLFLAYTPFNWMTGLIWTGSVSALSVTGTVKAEYVEYE